MIAQASIAAALEAEQGSVAGMGLDRGFVKRWPRPQASAAIDAPTGRSRAVTNELVDALGVGWHAPLQPGLTPGTCATA